MPASSRLQALVDNYEAADEAGKRVIEGAADLVAKSARSVKRVGETGREKTMIHDGIN